MGRIVWQAPGPSQRRRLVRYTRDSRDTRDTGHSRIVTLPLGRQNLRRVWRWKQLPECRIVTIGPLRHRRATLLPGAVRADAR